LFSGVKTRRDQWHIYEISLDGSGFRQITFDDRQINIPDDPRRPGENKRIFGRYGDFSPAYLPDGRIVFASTRYPSQSGSCGQRALNLYVMNSDGSGMHRITTERAGAIDPYVLASGRIMYSHWADQMNVPAPAGPGLRPLEVERNFAPSF
jgi:Tol biopolymer transport system component